MIARAAYAALPSRLNGISLLIHKMHFTDFHPVSVGNIRRKMLHLSSAFTDPKYGVGSRTQVEYVSAEACPVDIAVGNTVTLTYGRGFDSKAYVNGVHIVAGDVPTVEVKK